MNLGAVCAGGLTALGAVLDFLCSPEEKERYCLWLETKLLTFRNVTRRTFGREEMTFAIALLEKVFGKRFWSGRRWISVSLVVLMALATGVLISLRLARFSQQQTEGNASDCLLPVSFLLIAMASSALSISLSIWLSRFALRFRAGTSLVGVLCLLTVHIFLFA